MVNGLGVLGWGVGGIEAEAAMLGQPISMLLPQVLGFKLSGELPEGATATDLVLTVTEMLRERGVVSKFVEFFGPGLPTLGLADRATLGNMSPEFGSTCAIFPVDAETLRYLDLTGRPTETIELVDAYAREQGMFHDASTPDPVFSDLLELDLGDVVPSIAGPKRPQDRVPLDEAKQSFLEAMADFAPDAVEKLGNGRDEAIEESFPASDPPAEDHDDERGKPAARGQRLAGRDAREAALGRRDPGDAGRRDLRARPRPRRDRRDHLLHQHLEPERDDRRRTAGPERARQGPDPQAVGEDLAGAGLDGGHRLPAAGRARPSRSTRSGSTWSATAARPASATPGRSPRRSRRRSPRTTSPSAPSSPATATSRAGSTRTSRPTTSPRPPLVVAYALAGRMDLDITTEPLGEGCRRQAGLPARHLAIAARRSKKVVGESIAAEMYQAQLRRRLHAATRNGTRSTVPEGDRYTWPDSTYVRQPSFFQDIPADPPGLTPVEGARVLAVLGDSVTTDHISPAGAIKEDSPAGQWLTEQGVEPGDFNSYGSRRGNHEVMIRGTFANIRLRNQLVEKAGGFTRHFPDGEETTIYDAAEAYAADGVPLVVLAGKEYGSGSSRDWAAKGTKLLGVRAVIAESFERIHRSNLIGMGVLPLQYADGENAASLGLTGAETFTIGDLEEGKAKTVTVTATTDDGDRRPSRPRSASTPPNEITYINNGGILQTVLRNLK